MFGRGGSVMVIRDRVVTLVVVLTDADGAVIADDSNTATGTIVDDD